MSEVTDRRTRLLTRSHVERLLDLPACIAAVESAFRMRGEEQGLPSQVLAFRAVDGGFHAKAAVLVMSKRAYFAAKVNANFPHNPSRRGLPTIQGVLALFDAATGVPLAVMDSIAITILRTAAATAVAARYLANPDATTVTVVGCGAQARAQLAALKTVRPIARAYAFDIRTAVMDDFCREASEQLGIPVVAAADLADATSASEIIVTCTTSRRAFLGIRHVRPGAFIAAVGADDEEKQEIEPALLAGSAVVCDSLEQCSAIGDLHHALEAGVMKLENVRAELGVVVVDPDRGRRDPDEVVIFDSTGVAFQDVAAAALVYESAERDDFGSSLFFGG